MHVIRGGGGGGGGGGGTIYISITKNNDDGLRVNLYEW